MTATLALPAHLAGLELARRLFPSGVALEACDPTGDCPPPLPGEHAAIARAVPSRRREFAAGRAAARRAMAQLGRPPAPIPMGADRAPIWPEGVTGSISHCRTTALAAVAPRRHMLALGLDVEEDAALEDDLIPATCTRSERAWLATRPRAQAGRWAKVIFSAKECAYKCQYVLTRRLFGFEGFEIALDPAAGRFTAMFADTVPPFARGARIDGRFAVGSGLIVTGTALAAERASWGGMTANHFSFR